MKETVTENRTKNSKYMKRHSISLLNLGNKILNNTITFQNHHLTNMRSMRLPSVRKDAEKRNCHSLLMGG